MNKKISEARIYDPVGDKPFPKNKKIDPESFEGARRIKKYLENSNHCPFCESEDIEGHSVEIDDGGAYQPVTCNNCFRQWNDLYTLIGIEEVK